MTNLIIILISIVFVVFIIVDIIHLVKFVTASKSEGVLVVKFYVSKFTIPTLVILIVLMAFSVWGFNKSDSYKNKASYLEEINNSGSEYIEQYISMAEADAGITINDPEVYIRNEVEKLRNFADSLTLVSVFQLLVVIGGIISALKNFYVITNSGLRAARMDDAIPVYADYERSERKLIVKAKDLNGKEQNLFTFSATPKNLASLGKIIRWEEYETQEEIQ